MRELLSRIDGALGVRYAAAELETIRKALCLELLGISAVTYYTKERLAPDYERDRKLETALRRLESGEPLQYVIGWVPFCGLQFKVDNRVLIPRPETSELVEWVAGDCTATGTLLDIGTGSGCIAVTLAHKLPSWRVQGWDISDGALELARENSLLNGTDVEFFRVDILNDPPLRQKYDVIVSNPPYVLEAEKSLMEPVVLEHEPHVALFVPDSDPLLFYTSIARYGRKALDKGGRLYFEINPIEATPLMQMLEQAGYRNIELRNDIYGKQRMIKAKL